MPSSKRNRREQGVDSAGWRADVEACETSGIKPHTANATARLDPQLPRLRCDGKEREDVWQCNCLERTFKRHGNLRFLWPYFGIFANEVEKTSVGEVEKTGATDPFQYRREGPRPL